MSENSNKDDQNVGDAWQDANKPLAANQNVVWYKLGGVAQDAMKRTLELSKEKTVPDRTEVKGLAENLGQHMLVARHDTYYGYSAHAPEVYASPDPREDDVFYMMCPIGDGRIDGKTQFIPQDSTPLTKEEEEKLTSVLFSAWGGHMPIVCETPIQLLPSGEKPEVSP